MKDDITIQGSFADPHFFGPPDLDPPFFEDFSVSNYSDRSDPDSN